MCSSFVGLLLLVMAASVTTFLVMLLVAFVSLTYDIFVKGDM